MDNSSPIQNESQTESPPFIVIAAPASLNSAGAKVKSSDATIKPRRISGKCCQITMVLGFSFLPQPPQRNTTLIKGNHADQGRSGLFDDTGNLLAALHKLNLASTTAAVRSTLPPNQASAIGQKDPWSQPAGVRTIRGRAHNHQVVM